MFPRLAALPGILILALPAAAQIFRLPDADACQKSE
jgi:hypothetical protein